MPIVHGVSPSPFVRKVRVFLEEKGAAYELKMQMPMNQPPEYLAISPLGKIPCYQDGDFALPDSSAICAYLERVHPSPALYPSDPKELGRALWYEEYADSRLAESVGPVFVERVLAPRVFQRETDEARVQEALETAIPPTFDYLEGEMREGQPLVGAHFSIADIAVGTQLQQIRHAQVEIDASRWPRLAAWAESTLSRPSFKGCVADEVKLFSGA